MKGINWKDINSIIIYVLDENLKFCALNYVIYFVCLNLCDFKTFNNNKREPNPAIEIVENDTDNNEPVENHLWCFNRQCKRVETHKNPSSSIKQTNNLINCCFPSLMSDRKYLS